MYSLSDKQVNFILDDITRHGIHTEGLQQNLLDHLCILIEQNLEEDGDFERCYAAILPSFYKTELRELEEETQFLLTQKHPIALLSRMQFFFLLFTILIGPFIAYNMLWLINDKQPTGWHLPFEIWAATLTYAIFPLLVLLVLFCTPDRFDPLIPQKAKILIGVKPFIKIVTEQPISIPYQGRISINSSTQQQTPDS